MIIDKPIAKLILWQCGTSTPPEERWLRASKPLVLYCTLLSIRPTVLSAVGHDLTVCLGEEG